MKIHSPIVTGSLSVSPTLTVTGSIQGTASFASTASLAQTASSADGFTVRQGLTGSSALFTGAITAQTLVVQQVTSSIVYSSGSNIFGNQLTDVQQMTGSLRVTGSGDHYIVGGKVGIGTTTPDNTYQGLTIFGTDPSLRLKTSSPSGWNWIECVNSSGVNNVSFGVNQTSTYFGVNMGAGMDNPEFIIISGSNNVGIGTRTPLSKFVVLGTDVNNYYTTDPTSTPQALVAGSQPEFLIGDTGNATNRTATLRLGTINGTYYTYGAYVRAIQGIGVNIYSLAFGTSDSAPATERMRITSAGSVGIGMSNPNYRLGINSSGINSYLQFTSATTGTGSADGFIVGSGDAGAAVLLNRENTDMVFYTNNTERMTISGSNGNVGIGTTTPSSKLQVKHTDSTSTVSATNTMSYRYGTASSLVSTGLDISAVSNNSSSSGSAAYIGFEMRAPALNGIHGTNAYLVLTSGSGTAYGDGQLDFYIRNNTAPYSFYNDGSTDSAYWMTSLMTLKSNGNLGIGTTSPSTKLHLSNTDADVELRLTANNTGATEYDPIIRFTGQSNSVTEGFKIWYDNSVGDTYFDNVYNGTDSDPAIRFRTETTATPINALTITHGGSVGIGDTTPSYQLELSTDSAAKPSTNTWTISSDERIKENIRPYTKGLSTIVEINPIEYDYNGKAGFKKGYGGIGIIAQDIINTIPEGVSTYKKKLNPEDEEDTELYNFNTHPLTYIMINAIKELKAEINSLKAEITQLKSN